MVTTTRSYVVGGGKRSLLNYACQYYGKHLNSGHLSITDTFSGPGTALVKKKKNASYSFECWMNNKNSVSYTGCCDTLVCHTFSKVCREKMDYLFKTFTHTLLFKIIEKMYKRNKINVTLYIYFFYVCNFIVKLILDVVFTIVLRRRIDDKQHSYFLFDWE